MNAASVSKANAGGLQRREESKRRRKRERERERERKLWEKKVRAATASPPAPALGRLWTDNVGLRPQTAAWLLSWCLCSAITSSQNIYRLEYSHPSTTSARHCPVNLPSLRELARGLSLPAEHEPTPTFLRLPALIVEWATCNSAVAITSLRGTR
jgi:hypothetical protein